MPKPKKQPQNVGIPIYLRPKQIQQLNELWHRTRIQRTELAREGIDLLLEKYKHILKGKGGKK